MRFLLFAVFCIGCGGNLASGDDAGPKKDATSDAPTPDAGFVSSLTFENVNGQGGQGVFFGRFFATAQQANGGCTTTKTGNCSTYMCPSTGPQTLSSAGTLTLTVGSSTSTVTQNANGDYSSTTSAFAGGDVLGVSASGGDVPAFGAQTVTSPGMIIVSPAPPSTISTAQDLTFTWSSGEPGASVLVAIARQGFNASESVGCTFDAIAGTGTIPQAQLAAISSGSPSGEILIGQERKTTFSSGTFVIDLAAIQDESLPITFQ